jgi:hypothetical protein
LIVVIVPENMEVVWELDDRQGYFEKLGGAGSRKRKKSLNNVSGALRRAVQVRAQKTRRLSGNKDSIRKWRKGHP